MELKKHNEQTGEIELDLNEKISLIRAERYACQSVSRKALPAERVSICLRNRIRLNDTIEDVKVWKHRTTSKTFYSGLMVCGSVWLCPVCAAKISERRRKELRQAFEQHKKENGHIALLTLTFSHKKKDKLKAILSLFSKATQKFMSGGAFQKIRDKMGLIGRVRALEVTYGSNGFHPHLHIALFYTNEVNLEDVKDEMYLLWEKACRKVGLIVNEDNGLRLDRGEMAEDYISKHGQWGSNQNAVKQKTWGIDQELTKAHIKKAKEIGSMMPFDFLRNYLATEDEEYLNLFREYADCFKGKRQLQWSQGLKKRFVLEDKSDEQLAKEQSEEADVLGSIDYAIWKDILKYNQRASFLDLCEKSTFEEAISFIKEFRKKRQVPRENLTRKMSD